MAERLVELALGTPAGLVPDMGGPRDYAMKDVVRGANLAPERAVGQRTWEDFLAERVAG